MNYRRIYDQIVHRGKNRINDSSVYLESHHIVPKCMGGTDEQSNLVLLTPEEHIVCHLLLAKLHPDNNKLHYAAHMMTHRIKNNKHYGWVRREFAKRIGDHNRGRKNGPLSEEHKAKLSRILSGREKTPMTEETKQKISAANKGRVAPNKGKTGHVPWNKGVTGIPSPKKGKPGRKLTQEEKDHLSRLNKGKISGNRVYKPLSEEHKQKIKETRAAKPLSQESKERMLSGLKKYQAENAGKPRKPQSEESKRKRSEAMKRIRAERKDQWHKDKTAPTDK